MKKTTILTYCMGLAMPLFAQPGMLDSNFGGDGKVNHAVSSGISQAKIVRVQPDGRIVAAGLSSNGTDYDFSITRYYPDGSFDPNFSFDGQVVLDIESGSEDSPCALLLQPDGKIVVAGLSKMGTNFRFCLVRLLSDGTLDTSFDGDGKVFTDLGDVGEVSYAAALQSDGKILLTGAILDAGLRNLALLRYNSDGSLDTDFSFDGHTSLSIGAADDYGLSVLPLNDGNILVTGATEAAPGHDLFIARFLSDGGVDYSFGASGKVIVSYSINDIFWSAVYWNDRILLAGQSHNGTTYDISVARFLADGSPDTDFSFDGWTMTSLSVGGTDDTDEAQALTVQPDGKILVAGMTDKGTETDFALVRYNWDGSLDLDFGTNGKVVTDFMGADDRAYSLALQPNGLVVVSGSAEQVGTTQFALARYFTGINVGVLDLEVTQAIQLYPNPIENQAILTYTLEAATTLSLYVVNAQGQVVQTIFESQAHAAGDYQQPLHLEEHLPTGNYFLVFATEQGQQAVSFIKQ